MQKTCYYLDLNICLESKNSDGFFAKVIRVIFIKYFHKGAGAIKITKNTLKQI